jgi:hypothetical protein
MERDLGTEQQLTRFPDFSDATVGCAFERRCKKHSAGLVLSAMLCICVPTISLTYWKIKQPPATVYGANKLYQVQVLTV